MNRSNDDLDALADRLRALPEPPVPSGLEARLLAAVPDAGAFALRPRLRWGRLWLGGALAAAAVLLAVLLGRFFGKTDGTPDRPHPDAPPTPQVAVKRQPTPGNYRLTAYELPSSFEWPVQMTVPSAHRWPDELTD